VNHFSSGFSFSKTKSNHVNPCFCLSY